MAWVHDLATEPPLWRWTKGLLKASAGVSAAVICLSLLGGVTAHFSAAPAPTPKATEAAKDKVASSSDAAAQRTRKARMIPTDRAGSAEPTANAPAKPDAKTADLKPQAAPNAVPPVLDAKPAAPIAVAEQAAPESAEGGKTLAATRAAPEAAAPQLAEIAPPKANASEPARTEWVDPPRTLAAATAAAPGSADEATGTLAESTQALKRPAARAAKPVVLASTPEAAPPKAVVAAAPTRPARSPAVSDSSEEAPAPIYRRARAVAKAVRQAPEREEAAAAPLKRPARMISRQPVETAEADLRPGKRPTFAQRRFREKALARRDGRDVVGLEVMRVRTLEGPDGRRINVFLPPKLDPYQETAAYDAPRRFYAPQRRLDPVLNWLSASVP